jgi:hypothetical protein
MERFRLLGTIKTISSQKLVAELLVKYIIFNNCVDLVSLKRLYLVEGVRRCSIMMREYLNMLPQMFEHSERTWIESLFSIFSNPTVSVSILDGWTQWNTIKVD